jgi:TP901 family phage tail tape measure protein
VADRTTKVTLRLEVANYLEGMDKAAKKTRELGSESEKLAQKEKAFDVLGKASMAMGVVAAAGVALAIAKYAEFDQAMSNVQAATQSSAEDQKLLSAAALEAGATTVFSATESANAIEELSKAGLESADILGGALKGSLDLASAGQLGVARAAEIASTTLQQFKLDGSEAGHVADVLAAGAGKAMGSVDDLANGLKFVGPVADSMGISLEATTGVLALFAQQGIIGEQAGTSLRGVLSSLTAPSAQAAGEIKRLGIDLYDANGKFLGMENAAGELSDAYLTMDDSSRNASMGIIFGRETITAATALYQAGAGGVAQWTAAVDDSGYAAQVARDRLDNLKGDVEALGGAFDTALIQTGAAGNTVLREMTQTLTAVLDLYNGAPEPMKAVTLGALGIAAAVGLAGGAFFLAVPKVAQFNASLASMGPAAQRAGAMLTAAFGPVSVVLGGALAVLGMYASRQATIAAGTDSLTDTLDQQTGAYTKNTRAQVVNMLQQEGAYGNAKRAGVGQKELTDAIMEGGDALEAVQAKLAGENTFLSFFDGTGIAAGNASASVREVSESLEGTKEAFENAKAATDDKASSDSDAGDAAAEHTGALAALNEVAAEAKDSISELADVIRGFGSETLSVNDATRTFEASVDSLSQSVIDNGTTLDVTTEKGRNNQAALDDLAKSTYDLAAATVEKTGKESDAIPVMEAGRAKLIEMLAQFGITGDAANAYADELGLIPGNIPTIVTLSTSAAEQALRDFKARWENSTALRIPVNAGFTQEPGKATGGAIAGPGTGTSDTAGLFRLSNGEHVLTAADVAAMGGQAGVYAFRDSLYNSRGYASGGAVQYASSGSGSGSMSVSPVVSLAGATLSATIDGVPLKIVIKDQIAQAANADASRMLGGVQR